MAFLQRLVVGVVAKSVEHRTNLHALAPFLSEDVKQQHGNRVVSEVEVLQMDAVLCLTDSLKHIVKLLLTRHQERHAVVLCKVDAIVLQLLLYQCIR